MTAVVIPFTIDAVDLVAQRAAVPGGVAVAVAAGIATVVYDRVLDLGQISALALGASVVLPWVPANAGPPLVLLPATEAGIDDQRKQTLVATLAFEVAVRMNAATPITATAIITLILLASGNRAQSLAEIQALLGSGFAGERSLMGSDQEVGRTSQGVVRGQWFRRKRVKGGSSDPPLLQRLHQGRLVDQRRGEVGHHRRVVGRGVGRDDPQLGHARSSRSNACSRPTPR